MDDNTDETGLCLTCGRVAGPGQHECHSPGDAECEAWCTFVCSAMDAGRPYPTAIGSALTRVEEHGRVDRSERWRRIRQWAVDRLDELDKGAHS